MHRLPIAADITSKESIQKLVDEISAKESKLHILINNAGTSSPTQNTDQGDPKALEQRASTASLVQLSASRRFQGLVKTAQHHFAYNASKAAAVHLTKMLAHEIVSSQLKNRVNNIAPGVFPSEMTTDESDEKQKSTIPKEKFEGKVPAGRPGKDEDMASAVLFTVSNQYLNGKTIAIDGGYLLAAGTI
ncbi:unnamed protein product [Penicillium palitans]